MFLAIMKTNIHPLQQGLVDQLKADKAISSGQVENAFLQVPRHLFLRHLSTEAAYVNENIPTKHSATGEVISSASQPGVVAEILERLDLEAGQTVLEIGAGTGYNAALLANLVGEKGHVVSLDIDEDIVAGARDNLTHFGVSNVRVERADGHYGFEALAPYDRIVMSTSSSDVYPAWFDQLKEGGRFGFAVLLFEGERDGTFIVFEKQEGHFQSCAGAAVQFMPMRGGTPLLPELVDRQGEQTVREWQRQGKRFSRMLIFPAGAALPEDDKQIILKRPNSSFVFQWD